MLARLSWLIVFVPLIGCSDPEPKQPSTIAESYFNFIEKNSEGGGEFALAGPDVRASGEMLQHVVNQPYLLNTAGFMMVKRSTIDEAEKVGISECEERIGKGDCFNYFRNKKYVRIAERKKWLANNASVRKLITREKAEYRRQQELQLEKARLQQKNVSTPSTIVIPNNTKQPDYEAAGQLFDIANQALQSTLPTQRKAVTCNTLLNPLGGTTTCR